MSIPANIRVPFVFVEFDSSRAFQGASILSYKTLLIGQRTSTGAKAELQLVRLLSADQAAADFGNGSMLHRMAIKYFLNNRFTETYAIALDDAAAGVQATGSIAWVGTATAAGTASVLISGVLIPVAVTVGMTAAQISTALAAAINADTSLPVTAVGTTPTTAITAKNDGTVGNSIDIRLNYYSGEQLPAGITATVTAMASGATNPDIQDVIDVLGDEWYHVIICPLNDTANLTAMETELADRFGPMRMIDGMLVTAKRAAGASKAAKLSALSAFGNARNSAHVTCINATDSPMSEADFCAAYGAQLAKEGSVDPARPFQTLELAGLLPPAVLDRFTMAENNTLLYDGIATFQVDAAAAVRIQRAITMYQLNGAGAADIAYLDVNTLLTLMYMRYDFRNTILTKYPRAKLADDGVRVGPGQQIMTPKLGKAEAIAIFRRWEVLGLAENLTQFKNDLQCYRNISDPNRLEWVLPPDLINQFIVGAGQIQFLLQSPAL